MAGLNAIEIFLSPDEALDLEIKLNTSQYGREWIELGNILYKWRIDPTLYHVEGPRHFSINRDQYIWITKNIKDDKLNKPYSLIYIN